PYVRRQVRSRPSKRWRGRNTRSTVAASWSGAVRDYRSAGLPAKERTLLDYVWKLSRTPGDMTEADIDGLRAEGRTDPQIVATGARDGHFRAHESGRGGVRAYADSAAKIREGGRTKAYCH